MLDLQNLKLEEIESQIPEVNKEWMDKSRERTAQLVMPSRALGRLHEFAERLCAIQQRVHPCLDKKAILVFAGDHGVVEEGISPFPQAVTVEMVKCFMKQGAGINAICRQVGSEVYVVDAGIAQEVYLEDSAQAARFFKAKAGLGTANFAKGPAMSREEAKKSVLTGYLIAKELIDQGVRLFGTGEMGIGNTTPSAAIGCLVTGKTPEEMIGPGAGLDEKGMQKKLETVKKGLKVNNPNSEDGLDLLAKVGGYEIGGIAGCILACARFSVPVLVDGLISTAGALIADLLCPRVRDYMFSGHCSEEPGHKFMLQYLGLEPILNLGMRLGEGTGAALAMSVLEAGVRVHNEVFTFEQAGVSK